MGIIPLLPALAFSLLFRFQGARALTHVACDTAKTAANDLVSFFTHIISGTTCFEERETTLQVKI